MEDPCLGWVRETKARRGKPYDYEVISIVEEFLKSIRGFREKTRDLHLSVTEMSQNNGNTNLRPHLLTNLVQAFEEIICRYVLAAKELSWTNRARMNVPEDRINPELLKITRQWCDRADHGINELLDRAKRDIILLGTTKDEIDRLIIAPIGPEFLLASILSNIQNNTIVDPKRHKFLEISALEEELEALRMVIQIQSRVFATYGKTLHPESFQSATIDWAYVKDRQAMFPLKEKLIVSQSEKLAVDDGALELLQNVAKALRLDLKQSIEILEEGHGKAIRVFTIVTLFFLPFFFGMNTTDVRNIDWDQRIFWTSALPITFGVITLAFVYGYKWDSIVESLSRRVPSQRSRSPRHILEDDLIPLAEDKKTEPRKQANEPMEEEK
ncbi:hypothetical protein CSOJ01_03836 [Colletotrichum sojae]|uniref:Uncharacterized protein n=1 Tax=Colletotrichum sojae TaxID=2175907 RepID=A0A8H6JKT7_9PEZI|nr:hypothetical protein CSOJ01_03836 [Colletotrichum sojae]